MTSAKAEAGTGVVVREKIITASDFVHCDGKGFDSNFAHMSWTLPAAKVVPAHVGLEGARFKPSPRNPNFVNSQVPAGKPGHVDPLEYDVSRQQAHAAVLQLLSEDSQATIVTSREDYVHAEYQAMIFVDDVEFYFPEDIAIVDVRSGSRIGKSDLGANKRRYAKIAKAFSSLV